MSPAGLLTVRQLDALRLAANGLSDPQIADRLGITPAAATNRLVEAYRRLGVSNRAHAATVAMKLGLIRPDEIRLPARITEQDQP